MAVVGMKERGGKVVAKAFDKVNSKNIQRYIDGNVAQGSVLSTNEAMFYRPIKGYNKMMINQSANG